MGFKLNACAGLAIALMLGGCRPLFWYEDFAAKLMQKAAIAAGAQRERALLAEDFSHGSKALGRIRYGHYRR